MTPDRNRLLLALTATTCVVVLAAACSDEKGADDPLPITPTRCAIYWARENPIDESLDFFAVEQPIAAWTTGTGSYGGAQGATERLGTFVYRSPDGSVSLAESVGVTTSGEFNLILGGIAAGDSVHFDDSVGQQLVDARTSVDPPLVGTAGAGVFDGVWSALDAASESQIDWAGPGATVSILYLGSSITLGGAELGGHSAYAQCYDATAAFAPAPLAGGRVFHEARNDSAVRSGTRHGKGSR